MMETKSFQDLDLTRFELCAPAKSEALVRLHARLQPLSLLVCDERGRLIFGHEWLRTLPIQARRSPLPVQSLTVDETEAWLLAYRLLDSFQLVGLFEQLKLWHQLSSSLSLDELRRLLALPFPMSAQVQAALPELFSSPLLANLERDEIVWQVLFRLLERDRDEWPAWSRLFALTRFSRSRQIALLEALEDIVFRERCPLDEIVGSLSELSDQAGDRAERIWTSVFARRYPQTANLEERWAKRLGELGLPDGFSLRHSPFFESERVDLNAQFADMEAFLAFWDERKLL